MPEMVATLPSVRPAWPYHGGIPDKCHQKNIGRDNKMAYYLVRFYSGSGDRPPEQLIKEVVDNELRPKLQQGGGLNRYITFIADDGRIGSASVYETKEAAQNGLQIAREWADSTGAMQGYRL